MNREEIYLFGAGRICQRLLPLLKEQYEIAGVADNNREKWGSDIEGVTIVDPKLLPNSEKRVFLTIAWGVCPVIATQLIEMGVAEERIVLPELSTSDHTLHLFPWKQELHEKRQKSIEQYDLLNNPNETGEGVLIFCRFFTVYVINLIKNIKVRNKSQKISLITNSQEFTDSLSGMAEHVYYYETNLELADILEKLPVYDAFQTLWIESVWALHYKKMRNKCKCLNLFVGGSDFYRAGQEKLKFKKKLIDVADTIGIETEAIRSDFLKEYPEVKEKITLYRYGLEYIEQEKALASKETVYKRLGISPESMVITCAHNAYKEQQHLKMIDALSNMPKEILDRAVFVFPMTYGNSDKEYMKEVEDKLQNSPLKYLVFKEFMPYSELAEYISISNIYINVQTTDALSTTIMEEMYAGAVAVTGSWLPYYGLRNKGINFVSVDTIDDLTGAVADIITRFPFYKEEFKGNREKIFEMSSWEYMSKEWLKVWNLQKT